MPRSINALFVIRLVIWLVAALGVGCALLGLLVTFLCAMTGGPGEPPSGMSIDQFIDWRESGQWRRDSIVQSVMLAVGSILAAIFATVATMVWKSWNGHRGSGTT